MKFIFKYSTEVRFVFEIPENSTKASVKVCYTPWKPTRPKQKTSKLCGVFVDHPCRFRSFYKLLKEYHIYLFIFNLFIADKFYFIVQSD